MIRDVKGIRIADEDKVIAGFERMKNHIEILEKRIRLLEEKDNVGGGYDYPKKNTTRYRKWYGKK